MRNAFLLYIFILFISCNNPDVIKSKKLVDSINRLQKKADYRPLDLTEAYDFINKYYLPRLDTMPTGRKIFIYPLQGRDYHKIFLDKKAALEAEFAGKKPQVTVRPPDPLLSNKKFKWDSKRLENTIIVADTVNLLTQKNKSLSEIKKNKAWYKKFGVGYMCISYPIYNQHTKKLIIEEWFEDNFWCGTGRERTFYYKKTNAGWNYIEN